MTLPPKMAVLEAGVAQQRGEVALLLFAGELAGGDADAAARGQQAHRKEKDGHGGAKRRPTAGGGGLGGNGHDDHDDKHEWKDERK